MNSHQMTPEEADASHAILNHFLGKYRFSFTELHEYILQTTDKFNDINKTRRVYENIINQTLHRFVVIDTKDLTTMLFYVAENIPLVKVILKQEKLRDLLKASPSLEPIRMLHELSEKASIDECLYALIRTFMEMNQPIGLKQFKNLISYVPSRYQAEFIRNFENTSGIILSFEDLMHITEYRYQNLYDFLKAHKNCAWHNAEAFLRSDYNDQLNVEVILVNDGIIELLTSPRIRMSLQECSDAFGGIIYDYLAYIKKCPELVELMVALRRNNDNQQLEELLEHIRKDTPMQQDKFDQLMQGRSPDFIEAIKTVLKVAQPQPKLKREPSTAEIIVPPPKKPRSEIFHATPVPASIPDPQPRDKNIQEIIDKLTRYIAKVDNPIFAFKSPLFKSRRTANRDKNRAIAEKMKTALEKPHPDKNAAQVIQEVFSGYHYSMSTLYKYAKTQHAGQKHFIRSRDLNEIIAFANRIVDRELGAPKKNRRRR